MQKQGANNTPITHKPVANESTMDLGIESSLQFIDNRPEAVFQRKIQQLLNKRTQLRPIGDGQKENAQKETSTEVSTLPMHKELHGVARQLRENKVFQLEGDSFLVDVKSEQDNGKMPKDIFLGMVKNATKAVSEEEIKRIGQTAVQCPFIDYWISFYLTKTAAEIEKAVHIYEPSTAGVSDPLEVIKLIVSKVRAGLQNQLSKSPLDPTDPSNPELLTAQGQEVSDLTPPKQLMRDTGVIQMGCGNSTVEPDGGQGGGGGHFVSGGPVYMVDNDPTSELLDDNFDDTIRDQLNQPTDDGAVAAAVEAGSNIDVVLWRGTTGASVAAIQAASSAGGAAPQVNVAAPGLAVKKQQIAVGGATPEYTASRNLGFSFRHWLVVVRINTRYLARGSSSESGWICSPAAPVVVLNTVDRTLGLPEPQGLGAA